MFGFGGRGTAGMATAITTNDDRRAFTVLELDNRELARLYHAGWQCPEGGSRVLIGCSLPTREAVDQTVLLHISDTIFPRVAAWPK